MNYKEKINTAIHLSLIAIFCLANRAQAEQRENIIEKELNCVSQSLEAGGEIGWSDICYTWEEPPESKREKLINATLDSFEAARRNTVQPFIPGDYPRTSEALQERARKKTVTPKYSEDDIEGWLKAEYPYFYKEYMKKGERVKRYYGDEEATDGRSLIWSFMKNIDYGIVVQSEKEPTYYFETVFPIYQSENLEHTLFSHDRISSVSDGKSSYSVGLGHRYYNEDFPYIFGTNIFYDYTTDNNHYRIGYGAEFIREDVEGRINYYKALSSRKDIETRLTPAGRVVTHEQAVDGADIEFGFTVPQFPLAKIFGGYQWYDLSHDDDQVGWNSRLEVRPAPSVTLNFGMVDENNKDIKYRFDGRLNFSFSTFDPKDIMADIKGESIEPTRIRFEDRLLDRVERNFEIRTERWSELNSGISEVSISIVSPCLACGFPQDADGILEPGEGFEVNVTYTNLSSVAKTNILIDNETVSNTADFAFSLSAANTLDDVGPMQTVFTVNPEDLDLDIAGTAVNGDQTFISFDIISDQTTESFTFGPIIVGTTANGDTFSAL